MVELDDADVVRQADPWTLGACRGAVGPCPHTGLPLNPSTRCAPLQFAEAEGMGRLVQSIEGNTKRYQQLFAEVIDDIMPKPTEASEPDVADILAHHVCGKGVGELLRAHALHSILTL